MVELPEEIAVRLSVEMVLEIRSILLTVMVEMLVVAGEERRRHAVTERVGGGELRCVAKMRDGMRNDTRWR